MKIVVTIFGQDRVGIVAQVSALLAQYRVNIVDINQNIINGFFNMVMIAELTEKSISLKDLQQQFDLLGEDLGVTIKVQHADIFTAMHRI